MSATSGNRAKFVEQEVSRSVAAGQQFEAIIRVQNVGGTNWTKADGYKLGAQSPRDNTLWGTSRVELLPNEVIRPGQVKEFRFTVKAPNETGSYNFQWQMLREFVEWFGDLTPSLVVRVSAGEEVIRILEKYHVIVCGYPRYPRRRQVGDFDMNSEAGNIRYPEYGYPRGNTYFAKRQNTPEYGHRTRDLCLRYGIQILTGWWEGNDSDPWENYKAAFGSIDLKQLRLAYMFGVNIFPGSFQEVVNKVREWAPDTANRNRYAYIIDAKGESRPLMMIWGHVTAANGGRFRELIVEVRRLVREKSGQNPFLIMSEQAAAPEYREVVTSVDALYNHGCHIPPLNSTISTAESIPVTERSIITNRGAISGMKNYLTGQPVPYLPGSMPQFDRRLVPGDSHGTVEARSYEEVENMFKMVRKHAVTLQVERSVGGYDFVHHKWVTLTSMNEWPEGQTIEPSLVRGQKYKPPQCDYGYDFLEALKKVFADQVIVRPRREFEGRGDDFGRP